MVTVLLLEVIYEKPCENIPTHLVDMIHERHSRVAIGPYQKTSYSALMMMMMSMKIVIICWNIDLWLVYCCAEEKRGHC